MEVVAKIVQLTRLGETVFGDVLQEFTKRLPPTGLVTTPGRQHLQDDHEQKKKNRNQRDH